MAVGWDWLEDWYTRVGSSRRETDDVAAFSAAVSRRLRFRTREPANAAAGSTTPDRRGDPVVHLDGGHVVGILCVLFAGQLDEIWSWIRDLPLVVEIVLWVAFLPWMLGTAVWTSSWAMWIRVVLVLTFAVGWTVVSIPRRTKKR
jgi:hypothetical protein